MKTRSTGRFDDDEPALEYPSNDRDDDAPLWQQTSQQSSPQVPRRHDHEQPDYGPSDDQAALDDPVGPQEAINHLADSDLSAAGDAATNARWSAEHAESADVVDMPHSEEPEPKPRRSVALLAGFGVLFVGLVATVGSSMMGMFAAPKEPRGHAAENLGIPAVPVAVRSVEAVQSAAVIKPVVPLQPSGEAAATTASASLQTAAIPQSLGMDPAVIAALEAVLKDIQRDLRADMRSEVQRSATRLDARIEGLAHEVQALSQQRRTRPTAAASSRVTGVAGSTQAGTNKTTGSTKATASTAPTAVAKPTTVASKPASLAPKAKATAEQVARQTTPPPEPQTTPQTTLQGLSLRAVYPSTGADSQAWVMEGQALRVVARGSYIAGARVLQVHADHVVTERGVIR